jgi:uncharacterized membrane protein
MKYFKFLKKLSNILFIPLLVLLVCLLIFNDTLNSFKYVQLLRYLLVSMGIIVIIGALISNK